MCPCLLTIQTEGCLALHVKRTVQQVLIAVLFLVPLFGGAGLPILHAAVHSHAHDIQQTSEQNTHRQEVVTASAWVAAAQDALDQHGDQHNGIDFGCCQAHARCCASVAILTAFNSGPQTPVLTSTPSKRAAALPYGELTQPLLRPPKTIA